MGDLMVFDTVVRLVVGCREHEENQNDCVPQRGEKLRLLGMRGERAGGQTCDSSSIGFEASE